MAVAATYIVLQHGSCVKSLGPIITSETHSRVSNSTSLDQLHCLECIEPSPSIRTFVFSRLAPYHYTQLSTTCPHTPERERQSTEPSRRCIRIPNNRHSGAFDPPSHGVLMRHTQTEPWISLESPRPRGRCMRYFCLPHAVDACCLIKGASSQKAGQRNTSNRDKVCGMRACPIHSVSSILMSFIAIFEILFEPAVLFALVPSKCVRPARQV